MKRTAILAFALFILAAGGAPAQERQLPPELASPGEAGQLVAIESFSAGGGAISGTVVNKAANPIRNVKLLVQHRYRWPNEYKPGAVDPSRAEPVTIDAEIPPGASFAFTHPSQTPQPLGDGGHFDTTIAVMSFDRVIPAPPAPPASPAPPAPVTPPAATPAMP